MGLEFGGAGREQEIGIGQRDLFIFMLSFTFCPHCVRFTTHFIPAHTLRTQPPYPDHAYATPHLNHTPHPLATPSLTPHHTGRLLHPHTRELSLPSRLISFLGQILRIFRAFLVLLGCFYVKNRLDFAFKRERRERKEVGSFVFQQVGQDLFGLKSNQAQYCVFIFNAFLSSGRFPTTLYSIFHLNHITTLRIIPIIRADLSSHTRELSLPPRLNSFLTKKRT